MMGDDTVSESIDLSDVREAVIEGKMEIVNSNNCDQKSDRVDDNNKVTGNDETPDEGEGLELSIADVSSVVSSYNDGDNIGDDVNKSLKSEPQPEETRVKCPYCDFEFEEFSRDAFAEHLRSVHCIAQSLDILLEFSLNTLKKGNNRQTYVIVYCAGTHYSHKRLPEKASIILISGKDESERLECVSPEPLVAPESMPENLSDIESDDDIETFEDDNAKTSDAEEQKHLLGDPEIEDKPEAAAVEDGIEKEKEDCSEDTETAEASETADGESLSLSAPQDVADGETLSLSAPKDEEYCEEAVHDVKKEADALSDLSLSEEEFDNNGSGWVVLDETEGNKDESRKTAEIPTQQKRKTVSGGSSSERSGKTNRLSLTSTHQPSKKPKGPGGRVRTLPPELYNDPDFEAREYGGWRSRSPPRRRIAPPREERVRVAPPAPSSSGYEDRRDKVPRYEADYQDYQSRRPQEDNHYSSISGFPLMPSSGGVGVPPPPMPVYQSQYPNMVPGPGYSTGAAVSMQTPGKTAALQGYQVTDQQTATLQGYQVTDHLPRNYTESLHSLQPLQAYMSSKMAAMPGQPYPKNYIDLLISNVGKMLAQANLGLRSDKTNSSFLDPEDL